MNVDRLNECGEKNEAADHVYPSTPQPHRWLTYSDGFRADAAGQLPVCLDRLTANYVDCTGGYEKPTIFVGNIRAPVVTAALGVYADRSYGRLLHGGLVPLMSCIAWIVPGILIVGALN